MTLTIAHEALCLSLLFTVFCRFVKTNRSTRPAVRAAFLLLGLVAGLGAVGPLSLGWQASPFGVLLLAAILLLQSVTSLYWRGGPPANFQNDPDR